jgi:hypothetical protein
MKTHLQTITTLILLVVLVTACRGSGDDAKPSIKILSPIDQQTIALGETLKVESRSRDDKGVGQVELRVNGVQVALYDVPEGEKSFRAEQSWLPPAVGTYSIAVIAHDTKGQTSDPVEVSINVQPAPTPTPPTPPTAAPELTATSEQPPLQPQDCTYNATFVKDVSIPDNTELAPSAEFVKTWRLRNSGTCNWGPGFKLVFVEGDQMGSPAAVDVPPTPAGAMVDIEVHLKAPQETGTYRGEWHLRTPDGQDFGARPYTQIVVSSSITPSPSATPTAVALPKPDLDITLVSGNLELEVGQPLALKITIRNHGPGATEQPALVRFVLQTDMETETSVPTLPAGGELVASISHIFGEPAELEVIVSVDPDNKIDEENETNNTERIPVTINPPLYVTRTITVTPGLRFDLDNASGEEDQLDIEWRVVEGTVYVGLLNGAGAAPLSSEVANVSYSLVAGLKWELEQMAVPDLSEGSQFAFRTSDERLGYARVDEVLDLARTSVRLTYYIWDWP